MYQDVREVETCFETANFRHETGEYQGNNIFGRLEVSSAIDKIFS